MKITRKNRFGTLGSSVLAAALFYASTSYGQSLGDIARQEQERRKQEPRPSTYVYTNEDLKREQILVPEDRERVLAARRNESAPEIQVQAVEVPALPVPNLNVTMPAPELAIVPLATKLEVPASVPSPKTIRVVVKTTVVVHPQPQAHVQPVPSLPAVSFELASSAPRRTLQHRDINQTRRIVPIEETSSRTTVNFASANVTQAQSAPNRAQHREAKEAVTLVHFERTKSRTAPNFPSANLLLAASASHRTVQHQEAKPVVTVAGFVKKTTQVTPAIPNQEQAESAATVRVEHGDSLWKLAKEHLGSGTRWRELAEMNPEISNPGLIRVGDMIRLPNA
jgi:nucleoid-associated protein YgaU